MKKTNKKGFTIVELVIVIAVIAILAGVLIPTFAGVVEKANLSNATQAGRNAYTVALAEEIYDGDYDANTYYVSNGNVVEESAKGTDYITVVFTAGTSDPAITGFGKFAGYTFAVANGVYSCTKSGS